MKRSIKRSILGTLGVLCMGVCATDGTLNVSGTVDWSESSNWENGQIANGGLATLAGTGDVSLNQAVSLTGVGLHTSGSVTIGGTGSMRLGTTSPAEINVGSGQLTFKVPVQITTNLVFTGPSRVNLMQLVTAPNDTEGVHSALRLNGVTVGMDYSLCGVTANMLPTRNPLIVGASSTIRMGGVAECTQEFSSYDIYAPLCLGGGDVVKLQKVRYYSRNLGGITGKGTLTLGHYEDDWTYFHARDISTRYAAQVTVNGKGQLLVTPFEAASNRVPVVNGLLFHVDASASETLTTEVRNGRTVVTRWADASGGTNAAVAPEGAQAAVLLPNELNGRPVVDFGAASGNAGLDWLETLTNIRDVFLVLGSQDGGGTLLGTKQAETGFLYERGRNLHVAKGNGRAGDYTTPFTRDHAFFFSFNSINTPYAVYMNGTSDSGNINTALSALSGGYDLIEVVTTTNGVASAFARRAGLEAAKRGGREGGQRLAEVLVFNRRLNDNERKEVEAYLLKKWFNRDRRGYGPSRVHNVVLNPRGNWHEYGMLQSGSAGSLLCVDTLKIASSNTYYTLETADNIEAGRLDTERKLRLMGGRMAFTARQTSATLPVPHPAFHADATTGVTADGSGKVSSWSDASGGTVVAVPEDGYAPTLVANGLNGKPVVDFGNANSCQHLRWSSNIVVRALFFVLKVTNNKVSYLGSSSTSQMAVIDNFTRYLNAEDFIYNNGQHENNLVGGICHLDGMRILDPTQYRFNCATVGFRVLSHALDAGMMANAFGCGAYQTSNQRADRTGGLQIAEAIVYDRALTEDECLDVQAYLRWKWFGETLVGYAAPGAPYTLVAAGSGDSRSRLEIRGTAPVKVNELFGGQPLTLTAPETVVKIPAPQGTLVLRNAAVDLAANVAAEKITTQAGTTNLVTGTGTLAALTVNGGFDLRGGASTNVSALTFAAGSALLLGTGELETHTLALGAGVEIASTVSADHSCGMARTCDLSVAGSGSVTLTLDPSVVTDPCGVYPLVTFGSLAAEDAARFAQGTLRVVPALEASYVTRLRVVNNALCASISKTGITIIVR